MFPNQPPYPQPLGFPAQPNPHGLHPWPAPAVVNLSHFTNGQIVIQNWKSDGVLWTAQLDCPVWDIRGEWINGEQVHGASVSLLGIGTMGINRYLGVGIRTPVGNSPPASIVGFRAYSQEIVGVVDTTHMFSLPEIDRTTEVQSGGRNVATDNNPQGGSLLQFVVPIAARFWRVSLRFTYEVTLGNPPTLLIDMASN
jgi:hypothetical protein